ncbi:MAG: YifB family Mg chelatase-like AAA ATPase [Saccharofermentanales bacterium]|nr:YifB family Mg chelatase-like AAA ATPase [Clostridiaceae bacterium]
MAIRCGSVRSCALDGIKGIVVDIEASLLPGLPSFDIVGQGDSAVRESRNRVHAAIKNSGYQFPSCRITTSLAPAWIRKGGSGFDLPLALAILIASGQVRQPDRLFCAFGELGLTGEVRGVPGTICRVARCLEKGLTPIIVPHANASEARAVQAEGLIAIGCLRELIDYIQSGRLSTSSSTKATPKMSEGKFSSENLPRSSLAAIRGQEKAVRGIQIAAAGRHNILLLGSPGCGKTSLASVLPDLLPPLNHQEALEITQIYSVAGFLRENEGLIRKRPFRAPHHSISRSAMIGGGSIPIPGEISLAHQGVLFLDEMTEFKMDVLDLLRQPLEERQVRLARLHHNVTYPSDFILIGAANPCRCGNYFEPDQLCRCTPDQIRRHLGNISGPLLDRMDLVTEMTRIGEDILPDCVSGRTNAGINLENVTQQITACWQVQLQRMQRTGQHSPGNGRQRGENLADHLEMDRSILDQAARMAGSLKLSVRGYQRLLRVARTIADLDGEEAVHYKHITEAMQYRLRSS